MNKYVSSIIPVENCTEKQLFIHACFADNLQDFYKEYIKQGGKKGRAQLFDTDGNGKLIHKYWCPSNICCESKEILTPENIDIKISYWFPFIWKPIRSDLKIKAMKDEAFGCQMIDCSCNDCKHLNREKSLCNKFNKKIIINPNTCHPQNQNCFEHRRS